MMNISFTDLAPENTLETIPFSTLMPEKDFRYHHTASRRGYESRKPNSDGSYGHIEPYTGKFGTGFVHIMPRWDTTRFVSVSYYIEQEVARA